MKIQLLGLRSDEGKVHTDVLVERSAVVGDGWTPETDRAMNEVLTAYDAMQVGRAGIGYSKVIVALEPDDV